jgi:hypothetical protein
MAPSPHKGITHMVGKEGEILWDDRHAPIYLANSYGRWDEAQVEGWYKQRNEVFDHSIAQGLKVFLISDISELAAPEATMRKRLGEFGQKYDTPYKGNWIGQVFIMTNPLLRGIVTAVNWLNPNGFVAPTFTAPTMAQAIQEMEKCYLREDLEVPSLPRDYKYPAYKDRG